MIKLFVSFCLAGLLPGYAAFAAEAEPATRTVPAASFVQVQGREFIGRDGEPLRLRGINLGNWLLPEGYMFHFTRAGSPREIENVVAELVGDVSAAEFWRAWRENYVTRDDLRLIKKMGFNSVRVPLNWRLFVSEDAPFRIEGPGWRLLDRVISWCREEQLYAIIDLHGAPGGQTGTNIDDSRGRPLLFDDPSAQRLTIDLWRKIAGRYCDESWVLGYDLLNEPIAHYFDKGRLNPLLGKFYRELVPAIREVDPHHVILLGGAQWNTQFEPLGAPFAPNLAFTFHLYWDEPERTSITRYLALRDKYNVPLWLGESGENTDDWIAKFRMVLEENGIGWCFWPYKKIDAANGVVSVLPPKDWPAVIAYADEPRDGEREGKAKKLPPLEVSRKVLSDLLQAIQIENCAINPGYVKALGLTPPAKTTE